LDCFYTNFDLEHIQEFKETLKTPNLGGINVTIPYKKDVIPFLDSLDPVAQEIGAVNVIKILPNQKLVGYNSDYYGFTESLKPLLNDSIKKALILGTGGASKAIAYALKQLNIQYTFVSRRPQTDQFTYSDLDEHILNDYRLIINCTPLGTHPDIANSPEIPYGFLTKNHVLYDLIYNPSETTFLKKGKKQGATIANGSQMLVLQAEKSWEIWNS